MKCNNEKRLNNLIKPIRKWLAGDQHRNALIILTEPKASTHLVLATKTTGNDMIPDMGLIVGMEPQLTDVLSLIVGEAMEVKPMQEPEADWEDTIDFTASCGDVPQSDSPAENSYSRQAVGAPSVNHEEVPRMALRA